MGCGSGKWKDRGAGKDATHNGGYKMRQRVFRRELDYLTDEPVWTLSLTAQPYQQARCRGKGGTGFASSWYTKVTACD